MRKNKNRGYQKLRVWKDAVEYYRQTWTVFRKFHYNLKRVASQAIACSDSVHRNISEGYCRRSIHEYLRFLYPNVGKVEDTPYTRRQGRSRSNLLQVLDNAVDGVLSAFLKGKQNNLKIMSIG